MAESLDNQPERRSASEDELDSDLLARVAKRDRHALTLLYGRYHGPLLRFTQRLTGDIETAQEAVNDTMLVVWQRASAFAGRSRVSTWIMGIAYRKAMKLRTRLQRWTVRFKAADWSNVVERTAGIEGHTGLVERDLMYRAIQLLPPKQRAVVELTYYFGYSYDEIAEIVDCPTNTVKTRMFHARARLKQLLPQLGHGGET
ncbi:MAG TPA: sigma-70 family RNA polymerase sigma factor [Gammaproteobacteria bacterium]|nr:sigma-70 family RNA polymerase sigma factor [Gammaproteobacteria bacterium]